MVCYMVEMEKMTTQLGRQQHLLAILDTLPEAAVLAVTTAAARVREEMEAAAQEWQVRRILEGADRGRTQAEYLPQPVDQE
jgi:hypothetical protein